MTELPRPDRVQSWLIGLAVLLYAAGYPLALAAEWAVGWLLVSAGGIVLLALGVVTIRRATMSDRSDERRGPGRPGGDRTATEQETSGRRETQR